MQRGAAAAVRGEGGGVVCVGVGGWGVEFELIRIIPAFNTAVPPA